MWTPKLTTQTAEPNADKITRRMDEESKRRDKEHRIEIKMKGIH